MLIDLGALCSLDKVVVVGASEKIGPELCGKPDDKCCNVTKVESSPRVLIEGPAVGGPCATSA